MEAKLVTHNESKEARQRATKLIEDVKKHAKIQDEYKFFIVLLGQGNVDVLHKMKMGNMI